MKNNNTQKKDFYITFIFLITLLCFNFVVLQVTKTRLLNRSKDIFNKTTEEVKYLSQVHFEKYLNVMLFGRKYFESNDFVDRKKFTAFYTEFLNKKDTLPLAIDNIAYVEKVTNKSDFVSRIKSENTATAFQFLYFSLDGISEKDEYYIFNYLVDHNPQTRLFGYDARENEGLRPYFDQSAREGTRALIGPVKLFGKEQFLLIDPVYRQGMSVVDRKKALKGFVVILLSPDKLFDNIAGDKPSLASINTEIYINGKNEPIYQKINIMDKIFEKKDEKFKDKISLSFADRTLTVYFDSPPSSQLTQGELVIPDILFIVGSVMIVSFFIIMIGYKTKWEEKP